MKKKYCQIHQFPDGLCSGLFFPFDFISFFSVSSAFFSVQVEISIVLKLIAIWVFSFYVLSTFSMVMKFIDTYFFWTKTTITTPID